MPVCVCLMDGPDGDRNTEPPPAKYATEMH